MTGYHYQEALKNAARTMVRVKNPRRLLKMIVRFIVKEVGINHASILMYDQAKSRYIFVDSQGSFRVPVKLVKLDRSNPLIGWFSERSEFQVKDIKVNREVLILKELDSWLSKSKTFTNGTAPLGERFRQLHDVMETLK